MSRPYVFHWQLATGNAILNPMVKKWSFKVFVFVWLALAISFVTLAVSLTVAAAGYRFNWQARTIIKTGLIVLESDPTGAAVEINGKDLAASTPLRQTYLLPGYYDVLIRLDGYMSFQKTVKVESGKAHYEDTITLFREVPEQLTLTAQEQTELSARLGEITPQLRDDKLEVRGSEIWVDDRLAARLFSEIKQVKWFPSKRAYFVQSDKALHVYQLDGSNDYVIAIFDSADATPFLVDQNGERLVFKRGESVVAYRIH